MPVAVSPSSHQLELLPPGLSPASLKRKIHSRTHQLKHVSQADHRRRQRNSRGLKSLAVEDDLDLAADCNFILPSDRPKLERQEAFRVPSYSNTPDDRHNLYRLGLLYDDEHVRGSYFNLDIIVHSEPVYSVRPAKRPRKRREAQFETQNSILPLGQSFSSLYGDIARAQLLASENNELSLVQDTSLPYDQDGYSFTTRHNARLTVIHELQEGSMLLSPPATPVTPATCISTPNLILDEDVEDFTLLDDELSSSAGENDTETISSATGDPWIMLGDDS